MARSSSGSVLGPGRTRSMRKCTAEIARGVLGDRRAAIYDVWTRCRMVWSTADDRFAVVGVRRSARRTAQASFEHAIERALNPARILSPAAGDAVRSRSPIAP